MSGSLLTKANSHAWSCEGCDKPSRETITQVMSWMHIPSTGLWMGKPTEGPRLIVYVRSWFLSLVFAKPDLGAQLHPVCRYGSPCALAIQESGDQASRMAGGPPAAPMQAFDDDDDEEYPLHASCAYCELDKTATQKLLNCAGCKVTRCESPLAACLRIQLTDCVCAQDCSCVL